MNMEQKKIEEDLIVATEQRKVIELRLKKTHQDFLNLQNMFEQDLNDLKVAQNKENLLHEDLYEAQKENIKQAMSVEGIKKVFGDATPFFLRLKEKALNKMQDVKDIFDGTNFDKKWVDERYNEYKEICIQKGEDIKSKEEFQKIALAIKKNDSELSSTSIYEKLGNISKEFGYAKETIKTVWQSMEIENKIVNFLNTDSTPEVILNKKDVFQNWILANSVKSKIKKIETKDLFSEYIQYIEDTHGKELLNELSYNFKSGSFTVALNRKFPKPAKIN